MAQRHKNIHIDSTTIDNEYVVYTDLSTKQMENIEGIVSVIDMRNAGQPYRLIQIDKRYDIQEVLQELEKLANEHAIQEKV